jgi:hypothetical protein
MAHVALKNTTVQLILTNTLITGSVAPFPRIARYASLMDGLLSVNFVGRCRVHSIASSTISAMKLLHAEEAKRPWFIAAGFIRPHLP